MGGIPETDRQRSSQRFPLPSLLIALASGGCHGGERSPPCSSLKDDLLLLTETSGTLTRVLIAQILQWTFRSFRPKQTPPSLCQMEEHHTRKAIHSFSASFCVGMLCFTYVSFTFLSTILIPRSSFQFYANISVRQMWVVEWAHKQLVRFRSLCLHVSSHLLSDLMSMKLTSV